MSLAGIDITSGKSTLSATGKQRCPKEANDTKIIG
jgi:hypothetical protein